jgi:serine/threonine protein kinase
VKLEQGAGLGAYTILERIGRGGMASVYRAYHPALDRYVAIKVLPELFADDPSYVERFRLEARSVARLKHPNILEVFDFGSVDATTYLVLELVEGGTLADRLGLPMRLRDAVGILEKVAGALDHAHAHGVLHRDIKPSNILIRRDGTPVLADFGLAKMAGSLRRLTGSGTVMGTPEYMSPEQAADEPLGPRSDLYSLGVVAYEMLTGRVPFGADTPAAILLSHVTKAMPATRELRGELEAHVEGVLRRALAKRPEERYGTAAELVAALRPAAWADEAPRAREPNAGRARGRRRRRQPGADRGMPRRCRLPRVHGGGRSERARRHPGVAARPRPARRPDAGDGRLRGLPQDQGGSARPAAAGRDADRAEPRQRQSPRARVGRR